MSASDPKVAGSGSPPGTRTASKKPLSPAAQRALAEAAVRRAQRDAARPPQETGGAAGPDPVRYGDWEKKGLATDF